MSVWYVGRVLFEIVAKRMFLYTNEEVKANKETNKVTETDGYYKMMAELIKIVLTRL